MSSFFYLTDAVGSGYVMSDTSTKGLGLTGSPLEYGKVISDDGFTRVVEVLNNAHVDRVFIDYLTSNTGVTTIHDLTAYNDNRGVMGISDLNLVGSIADFLAGSFTYAQLTSEMDYFSGSGFADTITSGGGADTIHGSSGNDALFGGTGNDQLFGDAGNDSLSGAAGADRLTGGLGRDALRGGDGNDLLTGGAGQDRLLGGAGIDKFDFNATSESTIALTSCDVITDFAHLTDQIDLSTIDARQATATNEAFTFIGEAAFTAAGQVRVYQHGADTIVAMNTSGAAVAEMIVQLSAFDASHLTKADFIL